MSVPDAILDGLGEAHYVVCPGSRNAPLTLAIAQRALAHTVVIDERSAGFHALGHALAGRRAVVVTTSGTATANLLPSVVEAHQADVPLVVLTADRPARLRDTGTNQTIIQPGLFAAYVRGEADLPPEATPEDAQATAAAAMRLAVEGHGPFHLNVQFEKPLEPTPDQVAARHAMAAPPRMPIDVPAPAIDLDLPSLQGRGVIVAGPGSPDVLALADTLRVPVLADCLSGQRRDGAIAHADALAPHAPLADWILQVGRLPTSKAVQDWIVASCDAGATRVRIDATGRGWDGLDAPGVLVTLEGHADVSTSLLAAAAPAPVGWREAWHAADAAVPGGSGEPHVPAEVAASIPGGTLFVGNSLAVRDLERHLPTGTTRILANRGASGIDGQIATAAACADAAVIGDVSFQHDIGSLALWPPGKRLVVLANGGGQIFAHLPVADVAGDAMDLFLTPPAVDIAAAAAAFGLRHARMAPGQALPDADVIEVVCEGGKEARAAHKAAVAADAARAWAAQTS